LTVATDPIEDFGSYQVAVVLFGGGSSMIVDVEESCARLGLDIAAIVKNVEGPDHALARARIIRADHVGPALTSCPYMVPIFTPGHRLAAHREAGARGFGEATAIVDPTAVVATSAVIGAGTYVNAGAVIAGAAKIGTFVFINRSASIGHHVEVDDFASIGPGAVLCGEVRLSRGAVVGAGAVVLPAVAVGSNAVVAAGAVVRESVPDHCLVAGNPARVVKTDYAGFRNLSV
jgi:sugar O-acyltransferase (sialic acid O-acetyltransferase NeuD family)